jgi:hypothetical protein
MTLPLKPIKKKYFKRPMKRMYSVVLVFSISLLLFFGVGLGVEHHVSLQRRTALRGVLFDLQKPLQASHVPFFLDFGTALGQVRERDLILGDIDVDIGVCVCDKGDERVVYETLQQHLSSRYHIHLREDLIQLYQKQDSNNSADVYFYRLQAQKWCFHDISTSQDLLFPLQYVSLQDSTEKLPLAARPHDFLVERYGESYMTPIPWDKGVDGGRTPVLWSTVLRCAMTWRDVLGIQK